MTKGSGTTGLLPPLCPHLLRPLYHSFCSGLISLLTLALNAGLLYCALLSWRLLTLEGMCSLLSFWGVTQICLSKFFPNQTYLSYILLEERQSLSLFLCSFPIAFVTMLNAEADFNYYCMLYSHCENTTDSKSEVLDFFFLHQSIPRITNMKHLKILISTDYNNEWHSTSVHLPPLYLTWVTIASSYHLSNTQHMSNISK